MANWTWTQVLWLLPTNWLCHRGKVFAGIPGALLPFHPSDEGASCPVLWLWSLQFNFFYLRSLSSTLLIGTVNHSYNKSFIALTVCQATLEQLLGPKQNVHSYGACILIKVHNSQKGSYTVKHAREKIKWCGSGNGEGTVFFRERI